MIASSTSRSRSLPNQISSPTKNVGEPNVPRATDCSVLSQQRLLHRRILHAFQHARAVEPGRIERRADHLRLVQLLRFLPHVVEHRLDVGAAGSRRFPPPPRRA